uniref:Uncharacterized protein n=1 Tax=Haptolina ericina TaxID=156174 RepID=A0A7S3AFF9_9EUKA
MTFIADLMGFRPSEPFFRRRLSASATINSRNNDKQPTARLSKQPQGAAISEGPHSDHAASSDWTRSAGVRYYHVVTASTVRGTLSVTPLRPPTCRRPLQVSQCWPTALVSIGCSVSSEQQNDHRTT